ncbi:hypothetical protein E4U42_006288 [Claviceps africana]|uniref:Zn(2)-C6 fungal-type domain-containing protein n=1 Tax=Claviceps africana TaxID=83212 RepID=A0A8K0J2T6_9HYPO|nr:hypothetical protein E4U42_006288 [Claviceps africana]
MGRKWRQRPIACQSCRRRKIRCSREFPCSNCTSRGIKCLQFYEPQEPHQIDALALADYGPDSVSQQTKLQRPPPDSSLWSLPSLPRDRREPISVLFPNPDVQVRLGRLENCIIGPNGPVATPLLSRGTIQDTDGASHDPQVEQQFLPDTLIRQLSPPQIFNIRQMAADTAWLGGNLIFNNPQVVFTSTSPAKSFFDASISFHLSPIRLIKMPYCILQDASTGRVAGGSRQMCIFLPLYHEACTIINTFSSDWTILSPIVHIPTLLLCIQNVYYCVQAQKPVSLDHLLLLLSIIAYVTYSSFLGDDVSRLFRSHVEAISRCATWIDASFAMSDEVKRRGLTTLACLQAQTILIKVSCYMEGSSVRNRSLASTSIAMAREMGIHRIDMPGEKRLGTNSPIEVETARRVWWDNCTIDWFLALFPGPQEGVYTIHPRHMAVNKPSNTAAGFGEEHHPLSTSRQTQTEQPGFSFFAERIRLAEIAREFIDSCPISQPISHEQKQDKLREYDSKLSELQRNLPSHLSVRRPGDLSGSQGPKTAAQIYQCLHINCLIYIKRSIVHLRFLSFANLDEKFSFGYQVCLSTARDIIWMFEVVKADHMWVVSRLRATTSLRTLLIASAIFLLDICSGTEIHDLRSERPEMIRAWQLLADMEEESNLVDQFLGFASQMLKKYRVSESIVAVLADAASLGQQHQHQHQQERKQEEQEDHQQHYQPPLSVPNQQYQTAMAPDTGLDPVENVGQLFTSPQVVPTMDAAQRWQMLDTDFDIKTMSWDNVLWGFDTVLM